MKTKREIELKIDSYLHTKDKFKKDSINIYNNFINYLIQNCGFDSKDDIKYIKGEDSRAQNKIAPNIILEDSFYTIEDETLEGNFRFTIIDYTFWFTITKSGDNFTIVNKFGGTPTTISDFSDSSISAIAENFTEDFYKIFNREPFYSLVKGDYIGFK